jgi:hypothetical protein
MCMSKCMCPAAGRESVSQSSHFHPEKMNYEAMQAAQHARNRRLSQMAHGPTMDVTTEEQSDHMPTVSHHSKRNSLGHAPSRSIDRSPRSLHESALSPTHMSVSAANSLAAPAVTYPIYQGHQTGSTPPRLQHSPQQSHRGSLSNASAHQSRSQQQHQSPSPIHQYEDNPLQLSADVHLSDLEDQPDDTRYEESEELMFDATTEGDMVAAAAMRSPMRVSEALAAHGHPAHQQHRHTSHHAQKPLNPSTHSPVPNHNISGLASEASALTGGASFAVGTPARGHSHPRKNSIGASLLGLAHHAQFTSPSAAASAASRGPSSSASFAALNAQRSFTSPPPQKQQQQQQQNLSTAARSAVPHLALSASPVIPPPPMRDQHRQRSDESVEHTPLGSPTFDMTTIRLPTSSADYQHHRQQQQQQQQIHHQLSPSSTNVPAAAAVPAPLFSPGRGLGAGTSGGVTSSQSAAVAHGGPVMRSGVSAVARSIGEMNLLSPNNNSRKQMQQHQQLHDTHSQQSAQPSASASTAAAAVALSSFSPTHYAHTAHTHSHSYPTVGDTNSSLGSMFSPRTRIARGAAFPTTAGSALLPLSPDQIYKQMQQQVQQTNSPLTPQLPPRKRAPQQSNVLSPSSENVVTARPVLHMDVSRGDNPLSLSPSDSIPASSPSPTSARDFRSPGDLQPSPSPTTAELAGLVRWPAQMGHTASEKWIQESSIPVSDSSSHERRPSLAALRAAEYIRRTYSPRALQEVEAEVTNATSSLSPSSSTTFTSTGSASRRSSLSGRRRSSVQHPLQQHHLSPPQPHTDLMHRIQQPADALAEQVQQVAARRRASVSGSLSISVNHSRSSSVIVNGANAPVTNNESVAGVGTNTVPPVVAVSHHSRSASAAPTASPFSHRLFDNFLVLGCSPSPAMLAQNLTVWTESPKVLLKFPHHATVEAGDVAEFAFPSDVRMERLDVGASSSGLASILYSGKQFTRGSNCHQFVLKTNQNIATANESEELYGVCVIAREMASLTDALGRVHDVSCPISYCILSRYPFFQLHQQVIMQILQLLHLKRVKHLAKVANQQTPTSITSPISPQSPTSPEMDPLSHPPNTSVNLVARLRGKPLGPHQVPACVQLLKKYYDTPVPGRGESLYLPAPKLLLPISFVRPNLSQTKERIALIAQWVCPLAWTLMSAEMLVDLLEILLREFKLIVVDTNLAMLSAAVLSCAPLLHPLIWSGVNLPILPNRLREFLEAPVPILVGVAELPTHLLNASNREEDMVIWYPSQGKLIMHKNFKRMLPSRSSLLSTLRPHFNELRRFAPVPSNLNNPPSSSPNAAKFGAALSAAAAAAAASWGSNSNTSTANSSLDVNSFNYSPSDQEHAHVKIILHFIETEVVSYINYVRKTEINPSEKEYKKMEPFIRLFRETQMLSHYLQSHEEDEEDY